MYDGIRIIEEATMVDTTEDWSRVRSHGRARRRMRRGHRQNVVVTHTPKTSAYTFDNGRTFVMHPVMADAFRKTVRKVRP